MNYEKKYKEALERAKDSYNYPSYPGFIRADVVFPELKESEDERIRKRIIHALHGDVLDMEETTKAIAWLEKQGEKPINYADEEIVEVVKDTSILDMVKPKFKVGDWITNGDYTWKIVEVKPLDYILQSQDGNIVYDTISYVDEQFHSFTIEDAKDGDVLATLAGAFIYNGNNGGGSCPGSYCGINTLGKFQTGVEHHWTGKKVYLATKEQRELLFSKMKEAGYEWDAEKKELKKIEQNNEMVEALRTEYEKGRADAIAEMKPAWSEEDETKLTTAQIFIKNTSLNGNDEIIEATIDWLKSLKDRVQSKQEWSEEDKTIADNLAWAIANDKIRPQDRDDYCDWLKSLKDRVQPKQEWSEEDKNIIKTIIEDLEYAEKKGYVLKNNIFLKEICWLKSLKNKIVK